MRNFNQGNLQSDQIQAKTDQESNKVAQALADKMSVAAKYEFLRDDKAQDEADQIAADVGNKGGESE